MSALADRERVVARGDHHARARGRAFGRHPPAAARVRQAFPGSTSTSRTRLRIHPAASSTGSRARCSCMRCATVDCAKGRKWSTRLPAAPRSPRRGSRGCSACRFTAVMPACTAPGKIRDVRALGGHCDLIDDPAAHPARAAEHAARGACHLDQFGLAERATDWRGNNNIAESILAQLAREPHPQPAWIVCGAGTGGTSATIGRYLRYRGLRTRLCVAEPTGGAFAAGWASRDRNARATQPTVIEGIGRTRVEPSFLFDVVDDVIEVDDDTSIAAPGCWRSCSAPLRRFVGHQPRRLPATGRAHARAWRARQHRQPAVRPRRTLRTDAVRRRDGWPARNRSRTAARRTATLPRAAGRGRRRNPVSAACAARPIPVRRDSALLFRLR